MRTTGRERLERIWGAVEREPGLRPAEVAQRLDLPRSSVSRALPAMDEHGFLLSEDSRGRLWPWRRRL